MESEQPPKSQQPQYQTSIKQQLLNMGFPLQKIQQIPTKCQSKQQAIQFLLANGQFPQMKQKCQNDEDDWLEDQDQDYKMIFVVRMDLKLSLNKIAQTVATTCLDAYKQILGKSKVNDLDQLAMINWTQGNQKKIVVKAQNQQELVDVLEKVKNTHIKYVTFYQFPSKLVAQKEVKVQQPKKKKEKVEKKKEQKEKEDKKEYMIDQKDEKKEEKNQDVKDDKKEEMKDEKKEENKQEQKMKPESVQPEKMQQQKQEDQQKKKRKQQKLKKKKQNKQKAKQEMMPQQNKKVDQTKPKEEPQQNKITQKQQQKQILVLGCFGPASQSQLDSLTKHFKLL